MVTLRERNDPLRLMGRRLLLAALAILVVSVLWAVRNVWNKEQESAQLKQEAQSQLADLQQRQAQLESDYVKLQTSRGMEEAVRGQYTMGRPGEGLIVIIEPQQPAPVQASTTLMQWFKDMWSHL